MQRPVLTEYRDLVDYLRDAIAFRRQADPEFSVLAFSRTLRKVSPALVSLVLKRQRKLTVDRADEFAKLLALSPIEKSYFRKWVARVEGGSSTEAAEPAPVLSVRQRKEVTTHILNDWLNVYVKDFFQIPEIREKPEQLADLIGHLASSQRIQKSIEFLMHEGHLRRTLSGAIEVETNLAVADPKISSLKIRQFHKAALGIAKQAIDLYQPSERLANTLVIPLNPESYQRLQELIEEFAEKLKDFAAENNEVGTRLYQFILNVSPVGGKLK